MMLSAPLRPRELFFAIGLAFGAFVFIIGMSASQFNNVVQKG